MDYIRFMLVPSPRAQTSFAGKSFARMFQLITISSWQTVGNTSGPVVFMSYVSNYFYMFF